MAIPMSRVQTLCSESERAVVQASRRPRLSQLTLAQAKSFTQRAQKLFEKWRDQSRTQSRTQARKVGAADTDTRTHDKVQVFQDALASLEARLAQLTATGKGGKTGSAAKPVKKARAQVHRATRAEVRAALAEKELVLNASKKSKQPAKIKPAAKAKPGLAAAKVKTQSAPPTAPAPTTEPAVSSSSRPKTTPATRTRGADRPALSGIQKKLADSLINQQAATVAAKQRRGAQSGLTNRVRGHVTARGRRAQGKRDSRNA